MTGYFGSGNNFRGLGRVQQFWIEFDFKKGLSSCWDGRPCQSKVGRKVGGWCAPFRGEGAGTPSYTMWPGPIPTSIPSGILIHRTVWPQYTNVTNR